ncbi:hypothetical protein RFI_39266, partial [Reticulomyxa filosa]
YIQQTMQISAMWNHSINFNLIYVALNLCGKDVNLTIQLLFAFEQWKFRDKNEQNYKKKKNEFLKRRCCNHNINLFAMFFSETHKKNATEFAAAVTINDGLPFVEKKIK